jgi:predicted methyltransferase
MRTTLVPLALALAAALVALFAGPAARAAGPDPAVYAAALDAPGRPGPDRERDVRDRPAEVLALAGIGPGMTVADVFGGGGYYAEILAGVVGPQGRVLLVNNAPYVSFAGKEYSSRFADGRLARVERSVVETCNLGLPTAGLDAALIVMSYHDLYHYDPEGWPRIDADRFLEQIRTAVKPGGIFLIVDHAARAGTGSTAAQALHRIDEEFAVADIERHGFRLERRWDGLRNAQDDRTRVVFDPTIRGHTDRFVHVYRRVR